MGVLVYPVLDRLNRAGLVIVFEPPSTTTMYKPLLLLLGRKTGARQLHQSLEGRGGGWAPNARLHREGVSMAIVNSRYDPGLPNLSIHGYCCALAKHVSPVDRCVIVPLCS